MEELKIIADLIISLGATGKEAFLWYLAAKSFGWVMIAGTFLGSVWLVIIALVRSQESERRLQELRDLVLSDAWGYVSSSHFHMIKKAVVRGMK